ncbi:MAG: DUF1559 domain-containing protein [Planctomycetota bacterium]|nr:DUF1559 domain-containing protein [Planctomycetota bacterium]
MPFEFTCPYCYKKTTVADDMAGQTGPCSGCGQRVTIPGEELTQPAAPNQTASVSAIAPGRSRTTPNSGLALRIAGGIAATGLLMCIALFITWPLFGRMQQQRNAVACITNMQRIANALNEYAADYGSYPPAVVCDSKGKPMYSWRILILQYLGEEELLSEFNLDQAWDSQQNALLIPKCPSIFKSPAIAIPSDSESHYSLLTGNGTLFPTSGPLGPGNISDGADQTLLVVEVRNDLHEWTKPGDVDFTQLDRRIGGTGKHVIGGNHDGGATAVFADGSDVWLPAEITPELLDALVTPNGQEPIDPKDFRFGDN